MNSRSAFCPDRYSLPALLSLSLLCGSHANAQTLPPKPIQSRQDFVERARRIKPDAMTEAQVEAILGKPDYKGRQGDVTGWFYGCEGPRKLPTLGIACFDETHHCYHVTGTLTPPPTSLIAEKELRATLLLLDQAPSYEQTDTGALIRVVNHLIPLGKAKVLAALREYVNVILPDLRPEHTNEWKTPVQPPPSSREALYTASKIVDRGQALLFLLRILFDVPPTANAPSGETLPIPYPRIGGMYPAPPADTTISPRFPIVLVGDIPLINLTGVALGGRAETVADELPFFEKNARLRTQPLRPTDHPEEVLAHFEASPQWFPYSISPGDKKEALYQPSVTEQEHYLTNLKEQILKLLAPLYPAVVKFEEQYKYFDGFLVNADTWQWNTIMADLKKYPVRWNPTTEEYERLSSPPTASER